MPKHETQSGATKRPTAPLRTAYYLNGSLFSVVPGHLLDDFLWMADHGMTAVAVSVYERDLSRPRLWAVFAEQAEKAGLKLFAVPSRWAGIVAGWPGAPSRFTATRPDTWVWNSDGSPRVEGCWGVMSSIHHPDTVAFLETCLDQLMTHPFAGLIWDEPKNLGIVDHSPAAVQALGADAPVDDHTAAACSVLDRLSVRARAIRPGLHISCFAYATHPDSVFRALAQCQGIDAIGCDGRPWTGAAGAAAGAVGHSLLDEGPRILEVVAAAGRAGMILVENMGVPNRLLPGLEEGILRCLDLPAAHQAVYYFGGDNEDPEAVMQATARALRARRPHTH